MAADPETDGDRLRAEVLIVGAGAAGLWCAEVAARGGRDVLVLEKTARTGTKVLASGGSRCNLTTTLEPQEAARLFGPKGERFLRHAFSVLGPRDVRDRFAGWGVPSVEAPLEKVFPASGNARDVRDAMERAARDAGARFVLDAAVVDVSRDGNAWSVGLADGRRAFGEALVLAAGGRSYPGTGTTGDGYAWLEALGLPLVEPVPALVPLSSPAPWTKDLAGIAWQTGEVALYGAQGKGKPLMRRARPVVFSHAGLSGPGAMDVSKHVARAALDGGLPFELRLDLLPALDRDALRDALVTSGSAPGAPRLNRALSATLEGRGVSELEFPPRRLFEAIAGQAGIGSGGEIPRANAVSKPQRHALVEALRGLRIPVDGTEGWDKAEVTAGGLDLRAVSPRSMAVNGLPGLFVIGELLDVDGPIGGLSFQAAWATAELAGLALGR